MNPREAGTVRARGAEFMIPCGSVGDSVNKGDLEDSPQHTHQRMDVCTELN